MMPPITTKETKEDEQQQEQKSSSSVPKDRRFKLSRACDRCRRRRIKCDEGHPCQSCLTSNSACTFEEPGKRTHPHKSKTAKIPVAVRQICHKRPPFDVHARHLCRRTATLEDRMHQLETLIQAIPPAVFAAGVNFKAANGVPQSPVDPSTSAQASFASSTHTYPSGVPPPSLTHFPLMNPSTFFAPTKPSSSRHSSPHGGFSLNGVSSNSPLSLDQLADEASRMSLAASYLYFDDEGYTRWQGETSCLPLLDLLVERHKVVTKQDPDTPMLHQASLSSEHPAGTDWFPDRTARRQANNPEVVWKLVTSFIAPDLMDSLVQCYLSTSYYLMPFLHVPSFLADYGNPQKWGEPGFAAFIVSICCLASRHIDDPRVRADPSDGNTAGTVWFDLFGRLRALPTADRPTVYTVQSVLIAGVYAIGLGKLSKAFALISEAITLSIDGGLHRSADAYDVFDAIEDEVRKRTFWCVYLWDKQASVHFGRPPMIRLRDCDVGEPAIVDDEYITREGIGLQPPEPESRMGAFVNCVRLFVVMEAVLDVPPSRHFGDGSPFLTRATTILTGFRRHKEMREEEALLDEICRSIPPHWAHSVETMASEDVIRVTQAERLHCLEQFIRMLIHRHRFSEIVAEKAYNQANCEEQGDAECEAMRVAHSCALQIVSSHLQIAAKGLMTYYGVHVIHQLTAAGRTLVAMLLNCHSKQLQPLISPALEALRSCVGLLRRFSGRYVCGLRSGDLMEEFCRITQIPLEPARQDQSASRSRPPWIRPVRKKTPSVAHSTASNDSPSHQSSPEAFSPSDAFLDLSGNAGSVNIPSSVQPFTSSSNGITPMATATPTNSQSHNHSHNFSMSGPSGDPSSFMNDGNIDMLGTPGPSGGPPALTQSDLLAMFGGEGGVDVAALLMSPELSSPRGPENDFYGSLGGSSLDGGHGQGLVSPS